MLLLLSLSTCGVTFSIKHTGVSIIFAIPILTSLVTFLLHGSYYSANRIVCPDRDIHRLLLSDLPLLPASELVPLYYSLVTS